jgi:hypothetical protein
MSAATTEALTLASGNQYLNAGRDLAGGWAKSSLGAAQGFAHAAFVENSTETATLHSIRTLMANEQVRD